MQTLTANVTDTNHRPRGAMPIAVEFHQDVPLTVHVALGTDTLVQHPGMDGALVGEMSILDFTTIRRVIAGLGDTEFFEPICAQIAQACHACNLSLIWGATSPAMPVDGDTDIGALVARGR